MQLPNVKFPGEWNMIFLSAFCCYVFTKLLNLQKVHQVVHRLVDTSLHLYSGGNDIIPIGDLIIQMRILCMKN